MTLPALGERWRKKRERCTKGYDFMALCAQLCISLLYVWPFLKTWNLMLSTYNISVYIFNQFYFWVLWFDRRNYVFKTDDWNYLKAEEVPLFLYHFNTFAVYIHTKEHIRKHPAGLIPRFFILYTQQSWRQWMRINIWQNDENIDINVFAKPRSDQTMCKSIAECQLGLTLKFPGFGWSLEPLPSQ